jgi:hypothetical protein
MPSYENHRKNVEFIPIIIIIVVSIRDLKAASIQLSREGGALQQFQHFILFHLLKKKSATHRLSICVCTIIGF